MPKDLFISYSRRDNANGRVTELVDRIKRDFAAFAGRDLEVFFDTKDISGMQDWRHRIWEGLRESRLLLACLSPSYIQSEYCEWEFIEYLKYEIGHLQGFNGVAPIYFVQVPGWDDKDFEERCAKWISELRRRKHFDLRPWCQLGEQSLLDSAVNERMTGLNREIARSILRGERAEKSPGRVDSPNLHFIGRTEQLRMLRENFIRPSHIGVITALNGLGGLGKTALAVQYAHAFADEYGGGRWQAQCAGKDDLRLALSELATPMGFEFTEEERQNADLAFDRTRRELKKRADVATPPWCLLLLDNVDQPELLSPAQTARLNGGDWLHVLATTRLGEKELHGAQKDRSFLTVDEMPPEDALALIEGYQRDHRFSSEQDREAARVIVRLLGGFTLAVESAAVYLWEFTDVTCTGFLARLQKEGLEGLDSAAAQGSEGILHGEKRLSATLRPTLERLHPIALLMLGFAALLPPDQVPLPWLRALIAERHPEMANDAEPGYPDPWKNTLSSLLSLRLLLPTGITDSQGQPLVARVHRLVQELVLREVSQQELEHREQTVIGLIYARDEALQKTTRWVEAQWELEPLEAMAVLWANAEHLWAAWLMNEVAVYRLGLAQWTRTERLMRQALAIDERSFGPDHRKVAIRLLNLAELLESTNRLDEAEPLIRRALVIREQNFGPDHPEVAVGLNALAQLLQRKNRLKEAEPLIRRALAIDERSLGPNHTAIATHLNTLALLLQATSRLEEAEALMRRALTINERSLGPEHLGLAGTLNVLAQLLQASNRLEEAEALMRRELAINERCYGPDHPDVARALNNLATLLTDRGRLEEAEPLMRSALAIDEQSYGADHPDVARVLNNLAQLLQAMNRPDEAEPLMYRALAIDEKSYGSDHPDVARDLNNLALLLEDTNRLEQAEPLMRNCLLILFDCSRATGYLHPNLQGVVNRYMTLLQRVGFSHEQIVSTLRQIAPDFIQ